MSKYFWAGLVALGGVACGAVEPESDSDSLAKESQINGPDTMIVYEGRSWVRADVLSDEERKSIIDAGRPRKNPSVEELAAMYRGQLLLKGVHYIEAEPNLEMVRKIQEGYAPETHSQIPREARKIHGSDTRASQVSVLSVYPRGTVAFGEQSCTGTKIGSTTMLTAAHCVFNTVTTNPVTNDTWVCGSGSVTAGTCTPPRWRWGVNGLNGNGDWSVSGCPGVVIPTAFVNITSATSDEERWAFAELDFAAVNFSGCTVPNVGWMGTIVANDSMLSGVVGSVLGYPVRATCPSASDGAVGFSGPGNTILGTTCPGVGSWPGSTLQYTNTAIPAGGAKLWGSSVVGVSPGTLHPAGTILTTIDITGGESGAALYWPINANGTDPRVIGVVSNSEDGFERFNRWTAGTFNFVAAYTGFPEDTL